MKQLFFLGFFSLMIITATAQQKSEELARAVEALRTAIVAGDSASLVKLTDAKLTYGHSAGKIENQQEFVSALASGKSDFQSMDISNQIVIVEGKTGVVRHNIAAMIAENGKFNAVKLHVLLVWHKENKEWKLIARQAVKI